MRGKGYVHQVFESCKFISPSSYGLAGANFISGGFRFERVGSRTGAACGAGFFAGRTTFFFRIIYLNFSLF